MDVRSQFSGRYKKDMSIENLRAKVARRKSITQKENRHKEYRKSRGLTLADANVSLMRDLTVVEEANESLMDKGHETKLGNQGRSKEQIIKDERRAMLQRFKEEKQLRKLKEQREKASKGVFKCGIYKPEISFIPVLATLTAAKVKQKDKPPAPSVTRVTRSTAKRETSANETRTRAIPVKVLSNDASANRAGPKGRGHTSVLKKNERENKVSAIPYARTTRSTTNTVSKLPSTVKAPAKNTIAMKTQKTTQEISPEMVTDKTQPPVADQSKDPEPIHKDTCIESENVPETSPVELERNPSFAPQNFVFQPLDGLSVFNFEPMTPNRANAFLTPTFTFSPMDGKRNFVVTREHNTEDQEDDVVFISEPSLPTGEVKLELGLNASIHDEVLECASDANSAPQASPAVTPPPCEPIAETIQAAQAEQPHDVPYFRDIVKSEIQKLTLLCSDWDKKIDMDIPEDAKDLIRTTVGQTRLLIAERFKQFEGLVDNCEFRRGEKETTCMDLEGFWDMIYFQIEDVIKKFVNLGKLEENAWQQDMAQTKKVVRKKIGPAATGKQNQGDNGRAAARSRLAAIKAAMKNKVKMEEPVVEGEVPVIPMQVDPVVFDAGFFRIESPAKLPGSFRTHSSSQTNTPKSCKKIVQPTGTPITSNIEEATDFKPEKSPSPVKSPVRKALFGMAEDSLQNQELDPVSQCPESTETNSVPVVVDLTKYLVPTHVTSSSIVESPDLAKCLGLEGSETKNGSDTEAEINSSVADDVFLSSPETVVPTTFASSLPETGPDHDVKTISDPLDFLGSDTSMVAQSPMRVEPDAALSDLIMFSPMEK